MIKARQVAVAVGIALVTVAALMASDKTTRLVSFPSAQTKAVAPNGRFAVLNVDSDKEPHHTLFLLELHTNEKRKVLEYGRDVEVLWNPDSTAFAVNDYAGSNVGECLIFFTSDKPASINVGDDLLDRMPPGEELSTLHISDHIYWTALRWTSPLVLKLKVWGHTDMNPSRGFQYYHSYEIQR